MEKNSRNERQAQAGLARFGLLLLRQFAGENGNEHDGVDAQDELEHGELQQADPDFGIGEPVHGAKSWESAFRLQGKLVPTAPYTLRSALLVATLI